MNNKPQKKRYSEEQKTIIEQMASRGISDTIISGKTGVSMYTVQKITANYWEDKMKRRNE